MSLYKTIFDSALMNWIPLNGGDDFEQLDFPLMMDPTGPIAIRLKIFIGSRNYLIEILKGKGHFINREITEWLIESDLKLKFQCYDPLIQIGLESPTEEDEAMFLLKFS